MCNRSNQIKSNRTNCKTKSINSLHVHRNISGLHRRLLDGSSRQLITLNATSPEENNANTTTTATATSMGEQMNVNNVTANTSNGNPISTNTTATNVSNSTTSLASNPSSSMSASYSSSANTNQLINSSAITTSTFLASTSTYPKTYPMASPSSCLAIRRPSANMFVQFFNYSITNFPFRYKNVVRKMRI